MNNKKDEISNFIYASEKVFLLDNDESIIYHDIPFENGYSGAIGIEVILQSPTFIRNNYMDLDQLYSYKGLDDNLISKRFCHYNNTPYIPASSIKGMIRNLVEIISYSKLKGKIKENYLNRFDENSNHLSEDIDLSEALFGTLELKGRVNFSHLIANKNFDEDIEDSEKKEILMTPEAKKNKIGWKNYPLSNSLKPSKKGNNEDIVSQFIPLKKDIIFNGKVRFHNLRDFEIGALISALTFHNTAGCFHTIGMAKSLGYGRVKIKIDFKDTEKVLQAFEEKLNIKLFNGKILWHRDKIITELYKRHSFEEVSIIPFSNKISLELEDKKREEREESYLKNIEQYYQDILKNRINLTHPNPSNKKLKSVINSYYKNKIKPYFDINHLNKFLNKNDDIPKDIYKSFEELPKDKKNILILQLIKKRENNTILDDDIKVLFYLLEDN